MQENRPQLPLEVQLQAACLPSVRESYELLVSFIPELKKWDPDHESHELYKGRIKEHFKFSPVELIKYLEAHPEVCKTLLNDSYDKRYSPSTFIEEMKDGKYRVGWVTWNDNPLINQIRVFPAFWEAAADYVLFSWGLPRLTKEQSAWHEMAYY